jgi:hypothetical protein
MIEIRHTVRYLLIFLNRLHNISNYFKSLSVFSRPKEKIYSLFLINTYLKTNQIYYILMDSINFTDYYKLLGNTILLKRSVLYNIKKKNEPFPSEVQIQTTNSCNASCQMCPRAYIQK